MCVCLRVCVCMFVCVCVLEMAQLTLNIGASNPRCPHVKPPGIYHTELGETVFYVSQLLCVCVCVCVWLSVCVSV